MRTKTFTALKALNGMACTDLIVEENTMVAIVERIQLHSDKHLDEETMTIFEFHAGRPW